MIKCIICGNAINDEYHGISCESASYFRIKRHDELIIAIRNKIHSNKNPLLCCASNKNIKIIDGDALRPDIIFTTQNIEWCIDV
jgi:hypothetical protein